MTLLKKLSEILQQIHGEFSACQFDIWFFMPSATRSMLICLSYEMSLILPPGFFSTLNQRDPSYSLISELRPEDLVEEKLEKRAYLKVVKRLY